MKRASIQGIEKHRLSDNIDKNTAYKMLADTLRDDLLEID